MGVNENSLYIPCFLDPANTCICPLALFSALTLSELQDQGIAPETILDTLKNLQTTSPDAYIQIQEYMRQQLQKAGFENVCRRSAPDITSNQP